MEGNWKQFDICRLTFQRYLSHFSFISFQSIASNEKILTHLSGWAIEKIQFSFFTVFFSTTTMPLTYGIVSDNSLVLWVQSKYRWMRLCRWFYCRSYCALQQSISFGQSSFVLRYRCCSATVNMCDAITCHARNSSWCGHFGRSFICGCCLRWRCRWPNCCPKRISFSLRQCLVRSSVSTRYGNRTLNINHWLWLTHEI